MARKYNDDEFKEQCKVISWCDAHIAQCEALGMIVGSANGGSRSYKTVYDKSGRASKISLEGIRMKASGVRSGFPDLQLPIPIITHNRFYSGLAIEMKLIEFPYSTKTNKPLTVRYGETGPRQVKWQNNLRAYGHLVVTCFSAETIDRMHGGKKIQHRGAIDVICQYLQIDRAMIEAGRRYENWYSDWAVKNNVNVPERAYFHDEQFNDKLPF